jgi:two-component system copper resistance phosphate regulon response regulator CusR
VRLLIVEDEPIAAEVLARGLREHAYAVDVAVNGAAALEAAELNPYDLLILDVMLPGLNGLDLCRRLREQQIAVPVLMLTARDGLDDRVEGLDAGADDYLPKPYHFPELLARIRALLRRGPALQSPVLAIADLSVDTRARRVRRAGRTIDLTAKEYALLEYLLRRQGEVDSFDPMSNLIEVYIQRLRRRIDDGHPIKLIATRRGAGYTLSPGANADD